MKNLGLVEDSKVFKELMALYPWCSSFTVAYLKSLKTKNDLRFSSELEKYAVELNSRSVIYDLTKNFDEKIRSYVIILVLLILNVIDHLPN